MSFVSVQSLLNDIVTVHSVSSSLCTITQYLAMDKLDKKRLDL